jgi:hypothetical protein
MRDHMSTAPRFSARRKEREERLMTNPDAACVFCGARSDLDERHNPKRPDLGPRYACREASACLRRWLPTLARALRGPHLKERK